MHNCAVCFWYGRPRACNWGWGLLPLQLHIPVPLTLTHCPGLPHLQAEDAAGGVEGAEAAAEQQPGGSLAKRSRGADDMMPGA